MSGLVIWLAAALAPLTMVSTVQLRVDKKQGADEWVCLLDADVGTTIIQDGATDRVTMTVQKITARMEALPSMPETFREQIIKESPSQQRAVQSLEGKSVTFVVDHKTGKVKRETRLPGSVEFAGVDLTYWLARAWFSGAPRTVPTYWGKSWSLEGTTEGKATPYLAARATLSGTLGVGAGKEATELRLKITLSAKP